LVSDCYPPRLGGIEVQVAGLARALRRAGHQPLVITATPGPPERDVLRLPVANPVGAPVGLGAGRRLRQVLAGADVVHAHIGVLGPLAQQAAGIAASGRLPTLLTWHSLPGSSPLALALAPTWRRLVERGVRPTAVSTVAAEQLEGLLRLPEVPVLRNGLDVPAWTHGGARAHRGSSSSSRVSVPGGSGPGPRVVSAMRFSARKRPLHLIALLARVRERVPAHRRPRLSILGDGPWWSALRALVGGTTLREWVDLPGRIPRAHLAGHLADADLYVAASRHEAFGIAALEARCAGLPVAGYTGTGVRDVVQPGVGGVLATGDRQLSTALADLLADPARLRRYAEHHHRHPPWDHHWPAVTADTLGHYEGALQGLGREGGADARASRGA